MCFGLMTSHVWNLLDLPFLSVHTLGNPSQFWVQVKDDQRETQVPLLVVHGNGPSLLGRNWLSKIRLEIFTVRTQQSLESILEKHKEIFKPELGT